MVTEDSELGPWSERNVGKESRLEQDDLQRIRAMLVAMSRALAGADERTCEALHRAWQALCEPREGRD